jgi:hypothetical protein
MQAHLLRNIAGRLSTVGSKAKDETQDTQEKHEAPRQKNRLMMSIWRMQIL